MPIDTWQTTPHHGIGTPCARCGGLDGTAWPHGTDHQWPPLHPNCRCLITTAEVADPPASSLPAQTPPAADRVRLATGQLHLSAPKQRRYACTLLAAGPLKGHALTVTPEVLQAATPLFSNANAFIDHTDFIGGDGTEPLVDRIFRQTNVARLVGIHENVAFSSDRLTSELVLKSSPAAIWLQTFLD